MTDKQQRKATALEVRLFARFCSNSPQGIANAPDKLVIEEVDKIVAYVREITEERALAQTD